MLLEDTATSAQALTTLLANCKSIDPSLHDKIIYAAGEAAGFMRRLEKLGCHAAVNALSEDEKSDLTAIDDEIRQKIGKIILTLQGLYSNVCQSATSGDGDPDILQAEADRIATIIDQVNGLYAEPTANGLIETNAKGQLRLFA